METYYHSNHPKMGCYPQIPLKIGKSRNMKNRNNYYSNLLTTLQDHEGVLTPEKRYWVGCYGNMGIIAVYVSTCWEYLKMGYFYNTLVQKGS